MPKLLTVYGLARELGLSVDSIHRWIADGVIPGPRLGAGRGRVFTERQVREIRRAVAPLRSGRSRTGWARPAGGPGVLRRGG